MAVSRSSHRIRARMFTILLIILVIIVLGGGGGYYGYNRYGCLVYVGAQS